MESKITILDGAMGTMLQKAGLKPGEHPEVFGYNNPKIVIDIHKKYIEAGSDIVYTNTFGANSHKLSGCELSVDEAVKSAVHCAKEAAKESGVNVRLMLSNSQKLNFNRKVRNMPCTIMTATRAFFMFGRLCN